MERNLKMMPKLSQRQLLMAACVHPTSHKVCAADYTSEQGHLQEIPVVLSASRLSQPLSESPNAVTVIDRAMIKASGFRTIPDLFRLVPGEPSQ
jgi:iron complex outermembrane receptor protein